MLVNRARKVLVLCLIVAAIVGGAACGKAGKPSQAASTQLLSQGLKAHYAGRLDEAAKLYGDAIKADPKNKFAYYNLGVVDQTKGRLKQAESDYRQALAVDPNFVSALYNLAIIRVQAGAKQEGADLYRRAIAADPNNAAAHLNLGFLLRDDLGQKAEGDAELARAVQLDPSLASRVPASPPPSEGPAKAASPKP